MSTSPFSSQPSRPLSHPLNELYNLVHAQALVPLVDVLALGRYYRGFLLLSNRLRKQGLILECEASRLFLLGFHQDFHTCLKEYLGIIDPFDIRYSVELVFETAVDLFKHRKSFTPS